MTDAPRSRKHDTNRTLLVVRVLVVAVIVLVGALIGFSSHKMLTKAERRLAETQFEGVAGRALDKLADTAAQERWAVANLATVIAQMKPVTNAGAGDEATTTTTTNTWPFVAIPGFDIMASSLLHASAGSDLAFVPLVHSTEQPAFEAYANAVYQQSSGAIDTSSMIPPGAWGIRDPELGADPSNILMMPNGTIAPNGTLLDAMVAPVLQVTGSWPLPMYNILSHPVLRGAVHTVLECAKGLVEHENNDARATLDRPGSCGPRGCPHWV